MNAPAKITAAANCTGWLDWAGGDNPLPPGSRVVIRLRNGTSFPIGSLRKKGIAAAFLTWSHNGSHSREADIVAFRVVSLGALPASIPSDLERAA